MAVSGSISSQLFRDTPPAPKYNDARVLAAGVAETITIPATITCADFKTNVAGADCYINFNTGVACVVPAADITDGSAPSLNPGRVRGLVPGQTMSALSPSGGVLIIHWYTDPSV